jgi:hypothetical protein
MKGVSSARNTEAVMVLSEIPSPQKEPDALMRSALHSKPENKPESIVIPTPKDRLILAVVSLIMLLFLAGMTFGAVGILHAAYNGWIAILAVICFAVVTINAPMFLSSSQENRFNERSEI